MSVYKPLRKPENLIITNESGLAVFEKVPINNYEIYVKESKNFLNTKKVLNILGERTVQPVFNIFIGLQQQISSFLEVGIRDQQGNLLENVEVTALLLVSGDQVNAESTFFI